MAGFFAEGGKSVNGVMLDSVTTPAIPDLATLEYKLKQRGFKRGDGTLHDCETCHERAILQYVIAGRSGGKSISLCQACGQARAWRSTPGLDERVEEKNFDLRAFLG